MRVGTALRFEPGYLLGWRRAAARVRELQLLAHRKQEVIDALRWKSAQASPAH